MESVPKLPTFKVGDEVNVVGVPCCAGIVESVWPSAYGNGGLYEIRNIVSGELLPSCYSDKELEPRTVLVSKPVDAATATVGVKYDNGKASLALLSPIAIIKIGKVMDYGATKYADHNWRKGMQWSRLLSACLRHVFAYIGGENKDAETGLSHLAHAACCLMFLLEYEETHPELDNRFKPKRGA